MAIYFQSALMAATVLISTPVLAQGGVNLQFYEDATRAGGQFDGLSVACGKVSVTTAKAHRAKIRQDFTAKGLPAATFDRAYDGAYTDMVTKGKANPAQLKTACARVAAMGSAAQ